ncbi:MAG: DUF202 domain-containing protein [Lachnospiraceae bacterium]|jgi:uncharacterized membrane protein YidH (DUF202 family)|nr:DUF202 domain-containing protein [Lachnospiraceae bacterium]MBR3735792.1 DUF202 domain-containing protein [Lachnospiraceae bacterium]MBR6157971.1 DUF202 domain-containing protein [Lachnospiraceae bacterium]
MAEDKYSELSLADIQQMELSYERTNLSVIRTDLAFHNTKLSVEQTHLSFLRTIVSLIGSAATIYKALPALGVSDRFSTVLSVFLILAAVYFTVRDRMTYPRLKKQIEEMEKEKEQIVKSQPDASLILGDVDSDTDSD